MDVGYVAFSCDDIVACGDCANKASSGVCDEFGTSTSSVQLRVGLNSDAIATRGDDDDDDDDDDDGPGCSAILPSHPSLISLLSGLNSYIIRPTTGPPRSSSLAPRSLSRREKKQVFARFVLRTTVLAHPEDMI